MKYILLVNHSDYFNEWDLKSGRFPEVEETWNDSWFLSTEKSQESGQLGIIRYIDPTQHITVQSLKNSYLDLPVHGRYFAEVQDEQQFESFIESLSEELNNLLQKKQTNVRLLMPADFRGPKAAVQNHGSFFINNNLDRLELERMILFGITIMLFLYYIFNSSRSIGIMKMQGVSNLRLWWKYAGKLIIISYLITFAGGILYSIWLGESNYFNYYVVIETGKSAVALLLFSLLYIAYILSIRINQSIKHKKDTRSIFWLNLVIKVICTSTLILMMVDVVTVYTDWKSQQKQSYQDQSSLYTWEELGEYANIQAYAGYSTAFNPIEFENELASGDRVLTTLYPLLNSLGSIYIDASQYEEQSIILNRGNNHLLSIVINPNYLERFPIVDAENKSINIKEDDIDWVILAPLMYKNKEKTILNYYEDNRDFYLKPDSGQKIKIIWMNNNQHIFSFNPDVFPTEKNMIHGPLIHVKTEANNLFVYRSGIRGGGLRDPLKLKLIQNNTDTTYQKIKSELTSLQLNDQIKIVRLQDIVQQNINYTEKQVRESLLTLTGVFAIFILVLVQNIIIFFNKYQRAIIIYRLYGVGFFKAYRIYFYVSIISCIFSIVLSLIINLGLHNQYINEQSFFQLPFILFSLFGIETIMSIIVLRMVEKSKYVEILKRGV